MNVSVLGTSNCEVLDFLLHYFYLPCFSAVLLTELLKRNTFCKIKNSALCFFLKQ